jgi:signal transduction histidine kinase
MAADRAPRAARLATVRARTTAAAVLVVGLALAVVAVSLLVLLRRSLVTNIDEVAETRAEDVAALAKQGALPETLAVVGDEGGWAQVVDERGRVVSSTFGLDRHRPLATFVPTGPEAEARTVPGLPGVGGRLRLVALSAPTAAGPVTVFIGSSLEPMEETIGLLRGALLVGGPLVLALVGFTTWVVAGRALGPVDAIRRQVEEISERSLDRRVPVPPTADEVGRLAVTMNRMLDRVAASVERQRRFVADASHELQTPLASARTDLEVALRHPEIADWPETASALLAANERMERMVGDLLFLARTDGAAPRTTTPFDLDDVVLEEAEHLRRQGRVAVDTSRVSAAPVRGRREDVARAVRNLLDNAGRYAATRVTVEARTERDLERETERDSEGDRIILVVADDGPGIPARDRERVFERFTRLDDARARASGGTGLGLSIAREIIEAHGGTIEIGDAGPGARAVVTLPAG